MPSQPIPCFAAILGIFSSPTPRSPVTIPLSVKVRSTMLVDKSNAACFSLASSGLICKIALNLPSPTCFKMGAVIEAKSMSARVSFIG